MESVESPLDLFFGGDKKASLYVKAAFPHENFSEVAFPNPQSIKNTFLEQLMNPENYVDPTNQTNGIHNDFLTVIENAARYHASLNSVCYKKRDAAGVVGDVCAKAVDLLRKGTAYGKKTVEGARELGKGAVKKVGEGFAALKGKIGITTGGGPTLDNILRAYADEIDGDSGALYRTFMQVVMTADKALEYKYATGDKVGDFYNLSQEEISRLGKDENLSSYISFLYPIVNTELFVAMMPAYEGDYLRNVYNTAYISGGSIVNTEKFSLNWTVFLKNLHKANEAECKCQEDSHNTPSCNPCCDGLPDFTFTDFAYGKVWYYDERDCVYYQIVNGKRVNYDADLANETNCYGTYLKKCDEEGKCASLIECIASSDAKGMRDCISILKDKDLWNVAREDIARSDPKIVRDILKKFRIGAIDAKDENGRPYLTPMSFDDWENCKNEEYGLNTLDAQAQKFIRDNHNLKTYLKGIIAFCRANPAIINKFEPRVSRDGFGASGKTPFIERLGKRDYMDPREKSNTYSILANQLRSMPYETFLPAMLPRGLAGMHNLSLMDYRPGRMLGAALGGAHATFQQNGGNPNGPLALRDGSANIFEDVFRTIKYGLAEIGLRLSPKDEESIRCAIDKIRELENKLVQLVKRYSMAIKMGNSINANCYRVDRDNLREVAFNDVRDEQSARAFMSAHADGLQKAYGSLHNHYSNLCSSLTSQVFPRCLDMCCKDKKETDLPEPSSGKRFKGFSDAM